MPGVAFHVNSRRPVGIGKIVQLVGEVDRQGADRATDIIVFLEAETEERAIVLDCGLGFELLGAGMAAGHHMLAAVFDPFDRPSGFHRQQRH